ncbi:MAG: adenylate/guanylate cyclase domain-containing protein, partial [Gaiellaceae bacterium]
YEAGELGEAEVSALGSEDLAAEEDVFTQVVWRGALAKILAHKDCDRAVPLAEEAVARSDKTSSPNLRGDARLDLAKVLRECGDPENARAQADEARGRYEEKGNDAGVRRVNEFLEGLPK